MNIPTLAAMAAAIVAGSAWATSPPEKSCAAGGCSKKPACPAGQDCAVKDAACSKKTDAACSKKEAACSKKDAACSKK